MLSSRTRRLVAASGAAVLALAAPAASQAASKASAVKVVFAGTPVPAQKQFQKLGSDVNAFFPKSVTVAAGQPVAFSAAGFHTVDFPAKGGSMLPIIVPSGQSIAGANDAAGNAFWFNGQPELALNGALFAPPASQWGKKATYTGAARVASGLPASQKPKPFVVSFSKPGTYTYHCDLHPGMTGKVIVKAKNARVPSQKADTARIVNQIKADLTIAKGLATTKPPAGTIDVGAAGKNGVEMYAFVPSAVTVPVGTTLTFTMTGGSYEAHTATTGPGDPEKDPSSYLGKLSATFGGPTADQAALYPSDAPGAPASLTQSSHGNGFWSSGVMDANPSPLPKDNSVKFDQAGTYQFYCLIHPFMHATVTVQ